MTKVVTKKKKIGIGLSVGVAVLIVAVLLGLIFTGMYVGWGPFDGLFWNQEVKRISKEFPADENQNGIVFYGASNFRLWTDMTADLPEYKVVNSGFGGSTDKLMVQYADKLLYSYNPKVVFFQTGSNDYVEMAGTDEEKVNACIEYKRQMFSAFHDKLPDAKFVVMSGLLLPGRSEYTEITQKVNIALKALCDEREYMTFVDASAMTFDGEKYATELFQKDGIHLNHTGQLRWRDEYIKPAIERLLDQYPKLAEVKK